MEDFGAVNHIWVSVVKVALWIAYVIGAVYFGAKLINDVYSNVGKLVVVVLALLGLAYVTYELFG